MKMHLLPLGSFATLVAALTIFPTASAHAQPARQPADAQAQPARQAEAQAQQARQGDPTIQPPTAAQLYLRENYTKYEYKIPMRDGVHLFTAVYVPKDDDKPYPILLTRTPYTVKPYGEDLYPNPGGPMNHYAKEKFIFALQDVRGKNGSEGTFVHMRPILDKKSTPKDIDESTDAYDTIDWLVKHVPSNNGRVGIMGISYPGYYSACAMIDSHPALKCASPQAPISDWFIGDDFHHNGAFYLPHNFGFFATFGQKLDDPLRETAKRFDYKTPDGYEFYLNMGPLANADKLYFKGKIEFWNDALAHPNYDEFWQSRNLRPHLKNVHCAVMTVGGWYDAEDLFGTLEVYKNTERQNPGIYNILVMGPWYHGQWSSPDGDHLGSVDFNAKTAQDYRDKIELPFLKHFLKDEDKSDAVRASLDTAAAKTDAKDAAAEKGRRKDEFKLAEANVFETGTNQWRHYDAWPPKNAVEKTLYLHSGGHLSFEPPAANESSQFDEYVSDPAKPVPYIGYTAIGMTREHMVDDQRFAATRPDVLVYQTDPLEEDMTLAGPLSAHLHVSTTGTDSDFIVKLIDVYSGDFPNPFPNSASVQMGGYEQLVRGEPMRGKFRNSYEKPEAFKPGEMAYLNWTMPDINHTFRRGHRIMAQVQSTWFPLVDRNPQKFCDIYQCSPEDFQKATQRVYHTTQAPSQLRVMQLAQ
jgi:putative CocE/NonD family hydrolase